jgi:beta-glucosidase-like glycosyl hydrolase
VLKDTWGYKGWVMSDWGAVPSWEFALKGLDQESGAQLDVLAWKAEHYAEPFVGPLTMAYTEGKLSKERLSDMMRFPGRATRRVGLPTAVRIDAGFRLLPGCATCVRITTKGAQRTARSPVPNSCLGANCALIGRVS